MFLDQLAIPTVKIPSGELTNAPYIHYIATKRRPLIISTGMVTVDEIHEALVFIAYGLSFPWQGVDTTEVNAFYQTLVAKELLEKYVTVLHCTTQYLAPVHSINLKDMNEMHTTIQVTIGFSNHSEDIKIRSGAATIGTSVIEKHFILDKKMECPDRVASLNSEELKAIVRGIRVMKEALGDGIKKPTAIEPQDR